MCDPVSAIGAGLSAAGQVAGFMGQQQATDAYNDSAKQNAINANLAATQQYTDEQRKTLADAKQTNQQGYQAAIQARQAVGAAKASVGSAGMDMSSLSVNSILSNLHNQEAQSEYAVQDRHDQEVAGYNSRTTGEEMQAQGRINSMPYKNSPSPLGLALGIGAGSFDAFSKSPKGRALFGGN
jgi:uncharacterized membrane protein